MRWILAFMGVLLSSALVAISALMNWRFGLTLSQDPFDAQIFGALSVVVDCFKALIPIFCLALWRSRMPLTALVSLLFWLVFSVYSFFSAFGFSAVSREAVLNHQQADIKVYQSLKQERSRLLKQINATPNHRSVALIQADVSAAQLNSRWQSSSECRNATAYRSRLFCQNYARLAGELRAAQKAEREMTQWEVRLQEVNQQIRNNPGARLSRSVDPQVEQISKALPVSQDSVRFGLILLVAVLSELGSGLGFLVTFAAFGAMAPNRETQTTKLASTSGRDAVVKSSAPPAPPISIQPTALTLEDYIRERLSREDGQTINAGDLYEDFSVWCDLRGADYLKTITTTRFGREMTKHYLKTRKGGKIQYLDLAFKGGPLNLGAGANQALLENLAPVGNA